MCSMTPHQIQPKLRIGTSGSGMVSAPARETYFSGRCVSSNPARNPQFWAFSDELLTASSSRVCCWRPFFRILSRIRRMAKW